MNTIYKNIPIEFLNRGQYQPRQHFDKDALSELADSIKSLGLIEPLVVREISPSRYEIIAGERRWRASMLAKLTEVPCLISEYTDEQAAAVTIIENIQRQNLNLLEEAAAYQRLQTEFHFSQDEIAILVGKSRSHIANILRLLTLCKSVQERLITKQLSLGHVRPLVGLKDNEQEIIAKKAYDKSWSARQVEEEVRKLKSLPTKINPPINDNNILALQNHLTEYLGTTVEIISDNNQGGWLKIKFFDNDTLSGLLDKIGASYD